MGFDQVSVLLLSCAISAVVAFLVARYTISRQTLVGSLSKLVELNQKLVTVYQSLGFDTLRRSLVGELSAGEAVEALDGFISSFLEFRKAYPDYMPYLPEKAARQIEEVLKRYDDNNAPLLQRSMRSKHVGDPKAIAEYEQDVGEDLKKVFVDLAIRTLGTVEEVKKTVEDTIASLRKKKL